jgi:ArsR family transcriptional regulator
MAKTEASPDKGVGPPPPTRGDDVCEVRYVNERAVERVRAEPLSDEEALRLAETFKVLSDPTRVKILYALSRAELCVCDLSALLGMRESAVSHHLRLLRALKLVRYRKEGRMAYYSLDDEHIERLFRQGLEHVRET